jgi:uncharacterized membrane protein YheB (UPF0754 family)
MNKSLLTNLISIVLIFIGFLTPVYSVEIKSMGLYSFSGAITNWLAIHMLFEKIPFLYGSGIITDRFQEFKVGIKSLVMNQFFTQENFEKFMSQSSKGLIEIEEETILKSIDFDNVFVKLKSAIIESPFGGMLGMLGGEQALDPLKPQFEAKFKEIIHDLLNDENFIKNLTARSETDNSLLNNVQKIVDQRLEELTPKMVKDIIQDMIRVHLGWLVVWGGVFGAIIGLIVALVN